MTELNPAEQRRTWMATLSRATQEALEAHWAMVVDPPPLAMLKPPETGLVMVRARSGGAGDSFNLGEMTMTRCIVRSPEGIQGHAYVAGRAHRRAEIAARFDALLQMPDRHAGLMAGVIAPLAADHDERRRRRWAEAARTRVEFLTMVRGA